MGTDRDLHRVELTQGQSVIMGRPSGKLLRQVMWAIPANAGWVKGSGRDERGAEQNIAKIMPISDFPSPRVRSGSSPDHIGKPC